MTTPILSTLALAVLNAGLLTEQVIDNKKLSQEFLESQIDESKTTYTKIGDRLMHCTITTKTGFVVTGEALCASADNFDEKTGQAIAYDNAFEKLWQVYGFLLHQALNAG
ncbi:hypothetical protein LP117_08735 [Moraxella bovis]|uniref:Gp49 family protein n=1 Tax=Moraxella bovis TaxID=476 RepID=UPI002225BEFB|nr:Gp49 family protein [Moraxella bovis]UZA23867.1 hypothetical protein LP117_08735 [Moraxella bovis]UZA30120.1 hypothetical protein LP097_00140 [Moraxella bovis]